MIFFSNITIQELILKKVKSEKGGITVETEDTFVY